MVAGCTWTGGVTRLETCASGSGSSTRCCHNTLPEVNTVAILYPPGQRLNPVPKPSTNEIPALGSPVHWTGRTSSPPQAPLAPSQVPAARGRGAAHLCCRGRGARRAAAAAAAAGQTCSLWAGRPAPCASHALHWPLRVHRMRWTCVGAWACVHGCMARSWVQRHTFKAFVAHGKGMA